MNTYANNLAFMKKYAPVLHHSLTGEAPKYEIKIVDIDANNNFQIAYKGKVCFANSHYNIDEELQETFKSVDKECEVLVLLGIGNGQVIRYIKEHFKNLKGLFIVEPFLDIFKRYAERNSFQDVFAEMGLITFLVNKDENEASQVIQSVFENEQYSSLEVACLSSYAVLLGNYYDVFKERVLRGFRSRISQFVTLHQSRYNWLNNSISNFRYPDLNQERVLPLLKGKPAVIVAAGPSLNKHFHLLDKLKERAIFIGAGSAIKILNSKGIRPHFRMAIDGNPNEDIYDQNFFANSEDIPLFYASQLYHDILPNYKGYKIFMTLPTDALGQYVKKRMGQPYKLILSGASVVHSAFSFLCEAGCSPIIFIGQDMCFYENELYAEGRESTKLTRFAEKGWIKQKDIYGNDVYTIRNYLQVKYDYEGMLKNYPNIRFINATEGGLGIEGTELKPLAQVMEEDLKEDLNLDIKEELKKLANENEFRPDKIAEVINEALGEIDQIFEINKTRLKLLKKLEKATRKNPDKLNKLKEDFEYIDVGIENQLNEIDFYKTVVLSNVSVESIALKHKYKTTEGDDLGNLEKGEKYLLSMIAEEEVFCGVCKELIEEYFDVPKG